MQSKRLRAVVAAIPKGRWATYGDVAAVAGGTTMRDAIGLNRRLTDMEHKAGHRVLKGDGRVAENALDDPAGARRRLVREGIAFDERDRADPAARLERDELERLAGPA